MSVNVLCLDGGGVRGLSSLLILRNLFQTLSIQYELPELILPCDIFDIICGTSTGGIIALMLGRLRMSVDEAIDAYVDFSETVFEDTGVTDNPKYRYDASKVENWVKKIVTYSYYSRIVSAENEGRARPEYDASKVEEWEKKIDSKGAWDGKVTSLSDKSDPCCRTFVVAVQQAFADAPPKLFRTYAAKGRPGDGCEIWQAARATTAAFPFFAPATFGKPRSTYVGGELSGANNPSQLAIEEVERVFPDAEIGCLLSLGTGKPDDVVSIPDNEPGIATACKKLIESCELVHNKTFKHFQKNALKKEYTRLSVDRGLGKFQLDEWRETSLTGITERYLEHAEVEAQVTECIEILRERAEKAVKALEKEYTRLPVVTGLGELQLDERERTKAPTVPNWTLRSTERVETVKPPPKQAHENIPPPAYTSGETGGK